MQYSITSNYYLKKKVFYASYIPLIFTFFLSFLFTKVDAQQYLFDAQYISTDDGLANLLTRTIHQDHRGFIWISTQYGLNRYDGYSFQLYTKEKNGLFDNNWISRIEEDHNGNLWLFYSKTFSQYPGKIDAVDIFNPNTGKAIPIEVYFKENLPFKVSNITYTRNQDAKKRLWISTIEGALWLYGRDGFQKITAKKGNQYKLIASQSDDNIWVVGNSKITQLSLSGEILDVISYAHGLYRLWLGENDEIWATTRHFFEANKYRLFFWSKKKTDKELLPFKINPDGNTWVIDSKSSVFLERTQNGFWLTNYHEGKRKNFDINLLNSNGQRIYEYHALLNTSVGLTGGFFYETNNHFWIATMIGVLKLSIQENPFQLIHDKKPHFSDCRGIIEDESGGIYFINKDIYQWNPEMEQPRKITSSIWTSRNLLLKDSMLWAVTYTANGHGLQFDLKTGAIQKIEFPHPAYAYYVKDSQTILIGLEKGLIYYDTHLEKMLPFDAYNGFDELKESLVYHFHKNKHGIWLASDKGIFLMDHKKGIRQHFNQKNSDLPFEHIRHIHEDKEGIFWLATKGGGIIKWQPTLMKHKTNKSIQLTDKDGLSNNHTYAIYEDEYNKLWIPSDKGLMRMDKNTFQIKTYQVKDGLQHNEFNLASHYQDKDGTLYFGGLGGLISFHPRIFSKESLTFQSPLVFTSYSLLEKDAEEITNKTELLNTKNEITINPGDKYVELEFALLDYGKNNSHRYAYKLEGYSEQWNYTNDNVLRITSLPYGVYTLKIKGKNQASDWSDNELSLKINVPAPFYLQWWFLVLMLGIIIVLLVFLIKRREKRLLESQERLETEVKNRTKTIKQQTEKLKELDKAKTRFFSNITHEFRTPMTLIIGLTEQIRKENQLPIIHQKSSILSKNANRLLELINQLLDLSKLEGQKMGINTTFGDIILYTQELIRGFIPLTNQKNQILNFHTNIEIWSVGFDKDKWTKIIYNLLSNAVKFTPEEGKIEVLIKKLAAENAIELKVQNEGEVIPSEILERIFDRFYQADNSSTRGSEGTGIGLALVKELVEIQEGAISVQNLHDKGVVFKIWLPVKETKVSKMEATTPLPSIQHPILPTPTLSSTTTKIEDSNSEKLNVLLIEDNDDLRHYIRECIDESKYQIAEACNGEEGLKVAQSQIPDLIISDVMMPKKDGFEVLQTLRADIRTSHIPIILLTAKAALESRLKGFRYGADAYLTKPFVPTELVLRVEKLIEVRRMLQQRYQKTNELTMPSKKDHTYPQEDRFISELHSFILEHLEDTQLNGEKIGKHFSMSRSNLHRKLKSLTDQSTSEFLKSIRLEQSMKLVKEGKLNVSEICWKVGFSSVSHFSRSFKKHFGKAPSEFK